jgi:hypothetical protein
LLLILLPVFAGTPGAERLFAICCLIVLVSVVLHGGSPLLLARSGRREQLKEIGQSKLQSVQEESPAPAHSADSSSGVQRLVEDSAFPTPSTSSRRLNIIQPERDTIQKDSRNAGAQLDRERISIAELRDLWRTQQTVIILDVRTERSLEGSEWQAQGAVPVPPDHVEERVRELGFDRDAWLVAYCA